MGLPVPPSDKLWPLGAPPPQEFSNPFDVATPHLVLSKPHAYAVGLTRRLSHSIFASARVMAPTSLLPLPIQAANPSTTYCPVRMILIK